MKKYLLSAIAFFYTTLLWSNDLFISNPNDPYLNCSFSEEADLQEILKDNAEPMLSFQQAFEEDFNIEKQYEKINSYKIDEWEMLLFDQRNNQMKFIKTLNLNDKGRDFLTEEINYNYWHLLLAYSINRSNANTSLQTVTSLPRIMTQTLDHKAIQNKNSLISPSFRAFLPYYVIYFNSQNNGFKKYSSGSLSLKDKAEYAQENLRGDVLDYTLYRLIDLSSNIINTQSFSFWTSQIYEETLRNYLVETHYDKIEAREADLAKKEKEASEKGLPNIIDLNDEAFTFAKYRGKVVYVDFWASWCGPCRREFPFSKKMHESLSKKEKKQIVFLYISTDKDLEAWKKAVEKLGLSESGVNGHSYEVGAAYQIRSIPRYMIIDKNGKIVNANAPRPSNPETKQLLLELL